MLRVFPSIFTRDAGLQFPLFVMSVWLRRQSRPGSVRQQNVESLDSDPASGGLLVWLPVCLCLSGMTVASVSPGAAAAGILFVLFRFSGRRLFLRPASQWSSLHLQSLCSTNDQSESVLKSPASANGFVSGFKSAFKVQVVSSPYPLGDPLSFHRSSLDVSARETGWWRSLSVSFLCLPG